MDHKTGRRSNSSKKKWRHKVYHYTHTYLQTHAQMGIQTEKVPRKTHVNTASKEEKEGFKKESERYCGYSPERVHSSIT